ncbi:hypothetical protein HB779_03320 [Phyllobacterium sp. 628]|uniref:hypothetical protein n=1 Tax=Phyllobacterium sp. 628 TaxID=2718938 RepID=UPI0016628B00|nr:hypothetical protein [Phyllobacterium sp. 628]QND51026.1 hypothetical protein HB779_03320 [Phyllobacterium sp. 628]
MELTDKRLLVLEDEYLIGLELERIAEECGVRSTHVVSTVAELLFWIESQQTCDIAILEVKARGTSSLEAATRLQQRGIPVVFTTAYDQQRGGIPGFMDVPVVLKPYDTAQIVQAVAALSEKTASPSGVAPENDTSGELI